MYIEFFIMSVLCLSRREISDLSRKLRRASHGLCRSALPYRMPGFGSRFLHQERIFTMRKCLLYLSIFMIAAMLFGCSASKETVQEPAGGATGLPSATAAAGPEADTEDRENAASSGTEAAPLTGASAETSEASAIEPADISVAVLKGPTAVGMVGLMASSKNGTAANNYTFTVAGTADEITAGLVSGDISVAAIPCNLAATLYAKSSGKVVLLSTVNLGVLELVETGNSIRTLADLKGRTVYLTGAGTTPEYTFRYLLKEAGLDPDLDVELVFLSEATEVAARLAAEDSDAVALLPQPYVTSVLMTNSSARIALDLNDAWALYNDTPIVTGVLAANRAFLEENEDAVRIFLNEYSESSDAVSTDPDGTAELLEAFDIFKAAVIRQAIPYCSITFRTGAECRSCVEAYLKILFDANPASVGGSLPEDDFYYGAE